MQQNDLSGSSHRLIRSKERQTIRMVLEEILMECIKYTLIREMFWNRCNAAWRFKDLFSSSQTVLAGAVYGVWGSSKLLDPNSTSVCIMASILLYCTDRIDILLSIWQITSESNKTATLAQNVTSLIAHLWGYTCFSISLDNFHMHKQ